MILLDFEKPVAELQEQIEKAKEIGEKTKVDVSSTIAELEKKIVETREHLYENLTPWQKVQLSRHPERPYTLNYIRSLCGETFVELHGEDCER